jgi:hypothetical protein
MTNQRSNEELFPEAFRVSGFVIPSSLVIRASSFVIAFFQRNSHDEFCRRRLRVAHR